MANTILQKVKDAISSLVTLEITTVVGPMTIKIEKGSIKTEIPEGGASQLKVIQSKINLIEGDITTFLHDEYVTGNLTGLRLFHDQQISQGREIIRSNFSALVDLSEKIGDEIDS